MMDYKNIARQIELNGLVVDFVRYINDNTKLDIVETWEYSNVYDWYQNSSKTLKLSDIIHSMRWSGGITSKGVWSRRRVNKLYSYPRIMVESLLCSPSSPISVYSRLEEFMSEYVDEHEVLRWSKLHHFRPIYTTATCLEEVLEDGFPYFGMAPDEEDIFNFGYRAGLDVDCLGLDIMIGDRTEDFEDVLVGFAVL